ncbi:MAG: RdgB/HAM1 family non-canonical purine NTP pyrophosphatase [Spirulina sp. SIO3F2]|nr:RdgB/HAM1 family non-canonical purine NTP pyrophosphatase [Spirulina sp. SIO3F2]
MSHPIQQLVVATGNPGKLQEMQSYLGDRVRDLCLKPPELDIEETGTTFAENARLKASQVAVALEQWAIADDSGLCVTALEGAPGLYSARYGATDNERIARLLRELGETTEREAYFICALAIARPDGSIAFESEGRCPGEILHETRGEGGFGYDPVFLVPEAQMTFAQMSAAQKDEISHRGRAFTTLLANWQNIH